MPQINWMITIIAQQDGQHCWEYGLLERAITSQRYTEAIKFLVLYYEQEQQHYTVLESKASTGGQVYLEPVEGPVQADLYDEKTLTVFFQKHVREVNYDKHLLLLWGHGAGLGFFARLEGKAQENDYLKGTALAELADKKYHAINNDLNTLAKLKTHFSIDYTRGERSLTMSVIDYFTDKYFPAQLWGEDKSAKAVDLLSNLLESRLSVLSPGKLKKILEASLKKKVTVALFLNCYTQCVESCLELKDKIELVIAPQTTIPFAGYNFTDIFSYLAGNKYEQKDFAEFVKTSYETLFAPESNFHAEFMTHYPGFPLQYVSFSAIVLEEFEILCKQIDIIANEFLANITTPMIDKLHGEQIVRGARNHCSDVSGGSCQMVDIFHFLNLCNEKLAGQNHTYNSAYATISQWKDVNLQSYLRPSQQVFLPSGREQSSSSPSGLSIFFPYRRGAAGDLIEIFLSTLYDDTNKDQCTFLQYSWDELIKNKEIRVEI